MGQEIPYFGLEFEKHYCHISNQHPRISLIAKFRKKNPQLSLNFGPKMPFLGIFGLEFEETIVIF